jgi:amino acid transporter
MATSSGGAELFSRRTSGLTRSVSPWSALIYAFVAPTMTAALLYSTQLHTLYPGANGLWATAFMVLLFPIGGIYVFMSLSMPRSGGEYIYVSRILHPLAGFVASWTLTIVGLNWSGLITQWVINWGLGNMLLAEGIIFKNQTMIDWGKYFSVTTADNRWWVWLIGTVLLVSIYYLMSRGTKAVMRVMWFGFIVMWAMLITFVIVALAAGPEATAAGMQANTGISMADLTAKVKELSGGAGLPAYSVTATIWAALAFANLSTLGCTYAANISGEIKRVNLAQPMAQFGGLAMCIVWWFVMTYALNYGLGENLMRTIGYLEQTGTASAEFGTYPIVTYMISWATNNWFLVLLAGPLAFGIAETVGTLLGLGFAPVRNLFAFSFDGLLPAWVNKVSRNGSPNNAVIVGGFIAWGVFTLSTFTTWYAYITYTVTIWMVGWILLGIAAMVFPYTRRDIFEKSPAVVQSRILGLPVITILGFLGFVVSAVTLYATLIVNETPTVSAVNLGATAAFFVALPIIIYAISWAWNRSRGVPMGLRFKSIPPD